MLLCLIAIDLGISQIEAERPNHPERIELNKTLLRHLVDVRMAVLTLDQSLIEESAGNVPAIASAKAANTFWRVFGDYWQLHGVETVDSLVHATLFCAGVGVMAHFGVSPNLGASILGAVVGGKPMQDVLKVFWQQKS